MRIIVGGPPLSPAVEERRKTNLDDDVWHITSTTMPKGRRKNAQVWRIKELEHLLLQRTEAPRLAT